MTVLPPLVLRAPRLFYAAAILFFIWSFALTYFDLHAGMPYPESMNPMIRLGLLRGLYQAALEALYIAANGVIAHILLAIWQDVALRRDHGGEP